MARAKQTAGGKTSRNMARERVLSRLVLMLSVIAVVRQEDAQ